MKGCLLDGKVVPVSEDIQNKSKQDPKSSRCDYISRMSDANLLTQNPILEMLPHLKTSGGEIGLCRE